MSNAGIQIDGNPTDEEAAAIVAAFSAYLSGGSTAADRRPAVYRSRWRIAALQQAADRAPLVYAESAAVRRAGR